MNDEITHGEQMRKNILIFVKRYVQEHGYSPSYREIADGVGLNATSSVRNHIERMLITGMLETDAGASFPRMLRVPGMVFVSRDTRIEQTNTCPDDIGVNHSTTI